MGSRLHGVSYEADFSGDASINTYGESSEGLIIERIESLQD
jgi:hypothetical protein